MSFKTIRTLTTFLTAIFQASHPSETDSTIDIRLQIAEPHPTNQLEVNSFQELIGSHLLEGFGERQNQIRIPRVIQYIHILLQ
ncbi:uncharacterized protein BJ212DRAFT_263641 [Suillus subaureus]|uniref:Uncharacterized protein n=1 Tax=Suillus subaureus TaxID=48587 RepID=A0A9P7E9G1_9AGAM|nr:uncharacterized protein BJ212DRAFT_263641 [Suillus subaureus]KAG1815212.1 hypothetical protein BJ212DRAFT_263641 [Suillus subaureus]